MTKASPPMAALSDALAERIDGRPVRAAVFTTFSFDPGFFEEQVLPLLFEGPFSHVRKVRMAQLEEALRPTSSVAVYYDRTALSEDAEPAQLDVRRIDVRRRTGAFHPKVVLVLVDDWLDEGEEGPSPQSLIVGILSANMTRAGWWENVEAFHFEELRDSSRDGTRSSFRSDLLSLILQIRRSAPEDEEQIALGMIRDFIVGHTPTGDFNQVSWGGRYYTRLFFGKEPLPRWLDGILRKDGWQLDLVAPFFDKGDAYAVKELLAALGTPPCRVFLPEDAEGQALVERGVYDAVASVAEWGRLPDSVVARAGAGRAQGLAPRRVHAKVIRFWKPDGGEVVLVGSPNLSRAGHSAYWSGNLEAAFLVDTTDGQDKLASWLQPLDRPAQKFASNPPAEEESGGAQIDISFRFDWQDRRLAFRLHSDLFGPIDVEEISGRGLFRIERGKAGGWRKAGEDTSAEVERILASTSLLVVRQGESTRRVLVREEGMTFKPSILSTLTPEEILLYWSLLTPEQKKEFLAEKLQAEARLEGLPAGGDGRRFAQAETLFGKFAGIFHSFQCFRRRIEECIDSGEDREAVARLFGEKYDSLPVLLDKVSEKASEDPVVAYVTFLCAKQVRDVLAGKYREFWKENRSAVGRLDSRLERISVLRLSTAADAEFLEWYEDVFLREIAPPKADEEE